MQSSRAISFSLLIAVERRQNDLFKPPKDRNFSWSGTKHAVESRHRRRCRNTLPFSGL